MNRVYTTIQGDMWDGIAKKIYGDEKYMNTLLVANISMKEIVVFPAGVSIICPEVPKEQNNITPPWKRSEP